MRSHSEETEGTSNRQTVIDALVVAIVDLVARLDHWRGSAGNLLTALGSGPWSNSPGTLANYLVDTMIPLQKHGVTVSIASTVVNGTREINIGKMWVVEPNWPDDELAADEARVADIVG